jgi:hypothetical protein
MKTIAKEFPRNIAGCRIIAHQIFYGDEIGSNHFLIHRRPAARRGWLTEVLSQILHPVTNCQPGGFFACEPVILRRGRNRGNSWLLVIQRCGFDV